MRLKILIACFAYGAISGTATAAGTHNQSTDAVCDMLSDDSLPSYMRKSLEARCEGKAEGAVEADITEGQGIVKKYKDGRWITLGTVSGVDKSWTTSYENKIFRFVSPDGKQSKSISTEGSGSSR